ncbi:serine dehydratase beta chain [Desulfosporosinus sp. I2]|uniref:serine dehydratase beta chain n=1 Tax=Desulfosporosinus sp. I2 TaxID=1617025 RepID=UPI00249F0780|nr:serine dehydratase beta chain [Desulfosporosinus sp. I2]
MVGPSSSHTAGPARIGLMAGQLMKNRIKNVTIVFDPQGSFAAVNKDQWSDRGFVAGLLGWGPDNRELNRALEEAAKQGISIELKIALLDEKHPNAVLLMLEDETGEIIILKAISLGGGMVQITEVKSFPVSISGDFFELLIFTHNLSKETLKKLQIEIGEMLSGFEISSVVMNGEVGLINIKTSNEVDHQVLCVINNIEGITGTRLVSPVLPVLSKRD